MIRINLGAGNDYRQEYINADLYSPIADIKCDIDKKLPWKDNSVDEILCIHTLEHAHDTIFTVNEMIRVCKPGAKIIIEVPHYRHESAIEAAHYKTFGEHFFNYWYESINEYQKLYPRTGYLKLDNIIQKPTMLGHLLFFDNLRSLLTNVLGIPLIFSLIFTLEVVSKTESI
jgi:SAM-dependent methyltransferase